jgi:hypothetical protein
MNFPSEQYITTSDGFSVPLSRVLGHPPIGVLRFAYYDVNAKGWRGEPGEYAVLVGHSSDQIELGGKVTFPGAAAASKAE